MEVVSGQTLRLHHLGGAVGRVGEAATAFPHRNKPLVLNVIGQWDEGEPRAEQVSWVKDTWAALRAAGAGDPYLNFLAHACGDRHPLPDPTTEIIMQPPTEGNSP